MRRYYPSRRGETIKNKLVRSINKILAGNSTTKHKKLMVRNIKSTLRQLPNKVLSTKCVRSK